MDEIIKGPARLLPKPASPVHAFISVNVVCDDDGNKITTAQVNALLAKLVQVEAERDRYKEVLERTERACSFPEDDLQRAILKVVRATLNGEENKFVALDAKEDDHAED